VTPARWRRQVAWVPQRPYLFSGTLAQNLALGRPDADPEALEEAVAVTGLGHLVGGLPRGLETAVGEGGLTLSAGERQRVALARAWLCDAPLVLLDEPAAHLDAAAEDELAVTLAPWLAGRSVVVAAHRVELVGRVDRVVHLPGPPARPPTEDDRQLVGGS
jgi:ATP-binding cassette subfamily C protein CydCD